MTHRRVMFLSKNNLKFKKIVNIVNVKIAIVKLLCSDQN